MFSFFNSLGTQSVIISPSYDFGVLLKLLNLKKYIYIEIYYMGRRPRFVRKKITLSHFQMLGVSFQPVLHDWCNKGRGMCYPVCGMVHIKEPLLLIGKSSLCGGSGFPFSLSECLTPYNRR